jgi:hypothetical protein
MIEKVATAQVQYIFAWLTSLVWHHLEILNKRAETILLHEKTPPHDGQKQDGEGAQKKDCIRKFA